MPERLTVWCHVKIAPVSASRSQHYREQPLASRQGSTCGHKNTRATSREIHPWVERLFMVCMSTSSAHARLQCLQGKQLLVSETNSARVCHGHKNYPRLKTRSEATLQAELEHRSSDCQMRKTRGSTPELHVRTSPVNWATEASSVHTFPSCIIREILSLESRTRNNFRTRVPLHVEINRPKLVCTNFSILRDQEKHTLESRTRINRRTGVHLRMKLFHCPSRLTNKYPLSRQGLKKQPDTRDSWN